MVNLISSERRQAPVSAPARAVLGGLALVAGIGLALPTASAAGASAVGVSPVGDNTAGVSAAPRASVADASAVSVSAAAGFSATGVSAAPRVSAADATAVGISAAPSANAVSVSAAPGLSTTGARADLGDSARAQLVAARRAVISSGLSGRIDTLPFREGDRFKKGEVLVAYDCALNRARLERAVLAESAARKKQAVAEQLETLKSISRSDVEQARATVAVARAESNAERVLVDRCTLTAPFAGRVGETYVRASESVAEGEKLISIYDDSAFELEAIVPSRWLAWLKPGSPLRLTVDETGRTYVAAVANIAGAVDPVSQSVKIIGRLSDSPAATQDLLPGMSGSVSVQAPTSSLP